jgi:hypothetical protein
MTTDRLQTELPHSPLQRCARDLGNLAGLRHLVVRFSILLIGHGTSRDERAVVQMA